MDLKLDKKHENKITFFASDFSIPLANTIRRYSMTRQPILAIDKVTFYENNSAMFDEYLAHRLGLIPIVTPEKTSADVEISFRLDESGPKVVCSEDLKSSDKEITVARERIPVITLSEDQHLRFEATAKVGFGFQHAKFQGGLVSYGVEDKGIRFVVESFYQMQPAEVILRGCDALESDIKELAKQVKKATSGKKKK